MMDTLQSGHVAGRSGWRRVMSERRQSRCIVWPHRSTCARRTVGLWVGFCEGGCSGLRIIHDRQRRSLTGLRGGMTEKERTECFQRSSVIKTLTHISHTRHSEVELKRFSWQTGQFWCIEPCQKHQHQPERALCAECRLVPECIGDYSEVLLHSNIRKSRNEKSSLVHQPCTKDQHMVCNVQEIQIIGTCIFHSRHSGTASSKFRRRKSYKSCRNIPRICFRNLRRYKTVKRAALNRSLHIPPVSGMQLLKTINDWVPQQLTKK
jgi:hypothetical protein